MTVKEKKGESAKHRLRKKKKKKTPITATYGEEKTHLAETLEARRRRTVHEVHELRRQLEGGRLNFVASIEIKRLVWTRYTQSAHEGCNRVRNDQRVWGEQKERIRLAELESG